MSEKNLNLQGKKREEVQKYNAIVSSAIAETIRFSFDDEFRQKCFNLMQVDNTNECQILLKTRLDEIVQPKTNFNIDNLSDQKEALTQYEVADALFDSEYRCTSINKQESDNMSHNILENKPNSAEYITEQDVLLKEKRDNAELTLEDCHWKSDDSTDEKIPAGNHSENNREEEDLDSARFWPSEMCCTWQEKEPFEEETLTMDTDWD